MNKTQRLFDMENKKEFYLLVDVTICRQQVDISFTVMVLIKLHSKNSKCMHACMYVCMYALTYAAGMNL